MPERPLPLAAAALVLSGCATIFTGTTDPLTFDANVPGVKLSIDGQYLGELPLTVPMSRSFMGGQQFVAAFSKPGYATQEFKLRREFNTVAILDVTSLPTSAGVDALTGSLMKFSPTAYHVQMLREGQATTRAEVRRAVERYRYLLVSFRGIQKDLARGGGEYLASFAAAVCGGDEAARAALSAESLRNAPLLLGAATAQEFAERVDLLLADEPELRVYRP